MRISDWSSDVCSSDLIVAAARQVGTLAPRASYWSFSWHETNCPVSEDGRGCTCTPEVTVQPLHADVFIEVGMHGELVTMSRRSRWRDRSFRTGPCAHLSTREIGRTHV